MTFNINNVPNNANTFLPPTPVIPGMLLITGISRSYPMILQFDDSVENTYREGQVVVLTVPATYGMTQANGNQGKILRVFFNNFVLDIDSRQYDKFVVPSGNTVAQPASLAPGGARNLQFDNFTRLVPFQSLVEGIIMANPGLSINQIVFSTAGTFTYTPTSGMTSCIVEVIGAGGGGGSAIDGVAQAAGGGGGSGAYAVGTFSSSQIGSSQSLTVGSGGAGGTAGGNGNPGGTSSFGSFISCGGGSGGGGQNSSTTIGTVSGGAGGTASGSGVSYSNTGWCGGDATWFNHGGAGDLFARSGGGANSIYGYGGQSIGTTGAGSANGNSGTQGAGGGGALNSGSPGSNGGGNGGDGLIIITEFII